ncbi:hypothetical protein [Williamsia sp. CHRR-6]|uniref:hypothetical protein n=1 Tax=Williamsia sp. CHRR-6 TaxID=2835871 RepID=UPI001BDB3388|nr:hypothetical protein [Williamsia sp. CHRR-6]MBT0566198.1 hypothetical protein [Williamsia sp. CHRR-6]
MLTSQEPQLITCQSSGGAAVTVSATDVIVTVPRGIIGTYPVTLAPHELTAFVVDESTRSLIVGWQTIAHTGEIYHDVLLISDCEDPGWSLLLTAGLPRLPAEPQRARTFRTRNGAVLLLDDRLVVDTGSWRPRHRSVTIPLHLITAVDHDLRPDSTTREVGLRWHPGRGKRTLSFPDHAQARRFFIALDPPRYTIKPQWRDVKREQLVDTGADRIHAEVRQHWTTTIFDRIAHPDPRPRQRRLGRMGRRATVVPFLSTGPGGLMVGVGPDGQRWLEADRTWGEDSERASLTARDGSVITEIEAPTWSLTRTVRLGTHHGADLTARVNAMVFFYTRWNVRDHMRNRFITVTEPIRDAALRRVTRGLIGVFGLLGSDIGGIVIMLLVYSLVWPLSVVKPKFRYIIRDSTGRRIGVAESPVRSFDAAAAMTVWMDVDAIAAVSPQRLLGAIHVPVTTITLW